MPSNRHPSSLTDSAQPKHPRKIGRLLTDPCPGPRRRLTGNLTDHPPACPRRPTEPSQHPSKPAQPKPPHPAPPKTSPGGGPPTRPLEKIHPTSRKRTPVKPCTAPSKSRSRRPTPRQKRPSNQPTPQVYVIITQKSSIHMPRSYQHEYTRSRPISEVKQSWARLVLR